MMSIRIPKAGSSTLGFLVLIVGILFLFAGVIDRNPVAAQDIKIPPPTPTSTPSPNVMIVGENLALDNGVVLLCDALLQPLRLMSKEGQPVKARIGDMEIHQGLSSLEFFQGQTLSSLEPLIERVRQTKQPVAFVFTLVFDEECCLAGLGSLLPVGTIIEAGSQIELSITPDAITANLLRVSLPEDGDEDESLSSIPPQSNAQSTATQSSSTTVSPASVENFPDLVVYPSAVETEVETPFYDQLVLAQGYGGNTIVNIRNFDPNAGPLTAVLQAFSGAAGKFEEKIGGGTGRTTYVSTGDVNRDGSPDVVLSFGPITRSAIYPNIIVVRNADTREVIGHSFVAFPSGSESDVNYNGGEIRTAVGDFIGSGTPQIAAAQGVGGHGLIRLYQYTGLAAPRAWEVVGQFYGLPPDLVLQEGEKSGGIGLTLAAGDLDNDGLDELVVGQANGPKSQSIFHVLDINAKGGIQARHPYAGFKTQFRGNGGIELCVADLNGDGWREIIVSSMGNLKNFGDSRDTVPLNLVGIVKPIVKENQIVGFSRPSGKAVFNVFNDATNPSGAVSLTAGEFDGDFTNGKELVVGTGAFTEFINQEFSFRKSAPQARYRLLKIDMDGESVSNVRSLMGVGDGLIGFVDQSNPISGAINLGVIDRGRFKPVAPALPTTLALGDFTLSVEKYESYKWMSPYTTVLEATGTAWTEFDCNNPLFIGSILGISELIPVTLEIVATVLNPQTQVSLEEALKFDPSVLPGQNLILFLPKNELVISKPIIADELAGRLKLDRSLVGLLVRKEGQIRVQFKDCTIQVNFLDKKKGIISSGRACYPSASPYPSRISLKTAGFTTYLDSLCITPSSATAEAELEFPNSITSGLDCQPARLELGEIEITQDCQYYKSFPDEGFGTWRVDPTGIKIKGVGWIADFSKTWSYAAIPLMTTDWRGVVLQLGETVPGNPDKILSNYGYTQARYSFSNGLMTASGLTTPLSLMDPFQFTSLQPLDYSILIRNGGLNLQNNKITGGSFTNGQIILPQAAVLDTSGQPIKANYNTLTVQEDMDLFSDSLSISQNFMWGELSRTSPNYYAFSASKPEMEYFYLSAEIKPEFWPLDGTEFKSPILHSSVADQLEAQGIQGLIGLNLVGLTALTPDTPGRDPIYFKWANRSWMIVGSTGVHARFQIEAYENPNKLGPTHEAYYEGIDHENKKVPFLANLLIDIKQERLAEIQFVDSALYDCDLRGEVDLQGPTKAKVPFQDLQFTSTAHIAAARIVLSTPVPLDYWGVTLVQNPYQSTAGVMCVKTGQIFLTGSGIYEKRHFAQPFWLNWGEIMSSGQLDELKFDFNSSGQKFDGFPFVAGGIGLSTWEVTDATDKKNAYLQAGGMVYFDFFGGLYNNIKDYNNIANPAAPFNGRRIELSKDTAFNTQATETQIKRLWGNSFGAFDYQTRYDDADQDGYLGDGTMQFFNLVTGPLASSIVVSSTRICMQVYTPSDEERHDFAVGPVAHFGQMRRTTGCACVVNGQVERVHLSAELESTANANIALRSASYSNLEFDLTPSTWDLWIYGNMYLSLLVGADIEVTGQAHFAINRDESYVEGDVSGRIETTSLLGGGLTAEGRLEWHLGAPVSSTSYQSLQGRLSLEVVSLIGSSACEGGFYVGMNAPKEKAWVLADAGGRYSLNPNLLPSRLTGIYGYVRQSTSVNLYIVSGGYEVYVGLGAFVDVGTNPSSAIEAIVPGMPHLISNLGVRIWGKILGGLVSASASANLQIMIGPMPDPFGFEGSVELEACVLWVVCGSVDVHCGLNSTDGFYLH